MACDLVRDLPETPRVAAALLGCDPVGFYGAAVCLELRVPSPGMEPLFCNLYRPSPSASVLAGFMCGA